MRAGTSAAASTSTSFAKLLKSSKVISQYDPAIPSLVYTSHGGSFSRSDFGLKRALPRLKSPAIKVASLDTPTMKLTDFEYGSRELQFVKRWREAGTGISGCNPSEDYGYTSADEGYEASLTMVAEQPGACTWDRENFSSIQDLKDFARTGKSKPQRVKEQRIMQARKAQVEQALMKEAHDAVEPGLQPDYQNASQNLAWSQSPIEETSRTNVGSASNTSGSSEGSAGERTHDASTLPAKVGVDASQPTKTEPSKAETATQVQASNKEATPARKLSRFSPNYLEMSDTEFELFLEEVKQLRPQYRQRMQRRLKYNDDGAAGVVYDVFRNTTEEKIVKTETGVDVDVFLNAHLGVSSENKPSLDRLQSRPHHSLGLSYQPPNLYQSDVTNRKVPLRVLQQPKSAGTAATSGSRVYPVSAFGTVNFSKANDLHGAPTIAHYIPDSEGNLNTAYGQMQGQVEVATINPDYVRARSGQDPFYNVSSEEKNSFTAGRAPSSGASAASRSILDDAPISIRMYASKRAESENHPQLTFRQTDGKEADNRIGGRNWVHQDAEATAADNRPTSERATGDLFGIPGKDSSAKFGRTKISRPNPEEFVRPDGYTGARIAAQARSEGSNPLESLLGNAWIV